MNPKFPVYVISKGRESSCLTARELAAMGVPFLLVVEPQERAAYAENYPRAEILPTPFSNTGRGSIPARNFVWEHSRASGFRRHWILDDNIEGFHRLNRNEKYKVGDGTIFRCAEDFVCRYKNVPMAGMNYHSFCKATDAVPPFYLNGRIYSCTLIDNALPFRWRGRYNEDTDLSLRVLKAGFCTVLFNAFLCGKVTTMRMRGGNTDEVYSETDNRREFAESLARQHPDVARVVWKFGRWHHQVNYKRFRSNRLERLDGYEHPKRVNNYGMALSHSQN